MTIPRHEFQKVMGVLAAAYPRFELQPATISAYHAVLSDLDLNLLKAATLHLAATSKWFPAASEIRQTAFELVERESGVPDASQAWRAVMREVSRVGHSQPPDFGHAAIGEAVEAVGGWRQLCLSDNPVSERMRFIQAYEMMLQRERATMRMLPQVKEIAQKLAAPKRTGVLPRGEMPR